jgi:hypothetical protein
MNLIVIPMSLLLIACTMPVALRRRDRRRTGMVTAPALGARRLRRRGAPRGALVVKEVHS